MKTLKLNNLFILKREWSKKPSKQTLYQDILKYKFLTIYFIL